MEVLVAVLFAYVIYLRVEMKRLERRLNTHRRMFDDVWRDFYKMKRGGN